jgi:hypothetical protein
MQIQIQIASFLKRCMGGCCSVVPVGCSIYPLPHAAGIRSARQLSAGRLLHTLSIRSNKTMFLSYICNAAVFCISRAASDQGLQEREACTHAPAYARAPPAAPPHLIALPPAALVAARAGHAEGDTRARGDIPLGQVRQVDLPPAVTDVRTAPTGSRGQAGEGSQARGGSHTATKRARAPHHEPACFESNKTAIDTQDAVRASFTCIVHHQRRLIGCDPMETRNAQERTYT